jgi:SNF2 family DNA or RNA helicase
MKIYKHKEKIRIEFPYNPIIIEKIKRIDGRKFDPKTKTWDVPIFQIQKVLDTFSKHDIEISPELLEESKNYLKKERTLSRIKKGDFKESEEKIFKKIKLPLFDFQKIGAGFLSAAKSGLLGDEPGLGKSIQSLAYQRINDCKKILIICPSILKLNWFDELAKWDKGEKIVIAGTRTRREKLWKTKSKFYILNYELILKDFDLLDKIKWDLIIADEATRISNPKAKQSKLIKKINAKYRLALTGTPFNNSIQDVWNIIDFCRPDFLGTYWEFQDKYCLLDYFRTVTGYKNLDELKESIKTVMIRRLKNDVLKELPEKMYENIFVEFSKEEKQVYEAVKKELRNELKTLEINLATDRFLSNALVKMIRLMQVTDSLKLVSDREESTKIEVLKELLNDILDVNSKAIVYTRFSKMADILVEKLSEYNPLLISGRIDNDTRSKNVKKFTNEEKNKILIMTDAGSFGLNLQRAKYIIHVDLPWSISKIEQREGRAHRIGQSEKVTVYKIIIANSIDEYILKTLYRKQKQSSELLSDKKRISRVKISKKDLKNILN